MFTKSQNNAQNPHKYSHNKSVDPHHIPNCIQYVLSKMLVSATELGQLQNDFHFDVQLYLYEFTYTIP